MDLSEESSVVVRSTWGRRGMFFAAGTAAAWAVYAAVGRDWSGLAHAAPFMGLVLTAAASLWWWPRLTVSDHHLQLDGPLRRVQLDWSAIESVDSRLGLRITAAGRTFHSSAAAARSDVRAAGRGASLPALRPGRQVVDLDAHDAAALVESVVERHSDTAEPSPTDAVRVQWLWPRVALWLVLLAGAALVLLG